MVHLLWAILSAAISCFGAAGSPCPQLGCSPPVLTESGPVVGFEKNAENQRVSFFGALPYAAAPIGTLRFHYAGPHVQKWNETRRAFNLPYACVQAGGPGQYQSEDCLYLNVYAPSKAVGGNGTLLPVMFWIYGGGYIVGDSYSGGMTDGSNLAGRHDVVVVTHNYRLNLLGFNTYTTGPHGETGTQALADQRLAMAWVQRNIRGFGGDAQRVTIFGESAGAFSVMYHLVSPPSWPLFSKAIMQSGTSKVSWFFQPKDLASEFHQGWASAIGCDGHDLECLQSKNASAFVNCPKNYSGRNPIYPFFTVGPSVDGTEHGLRDVPSKLVEAGSFSKVPLLLGSNKDGGTIFEGMLTAYLTNGHKDAESDDDVKALIARDFAAKDAPSILSTYPSSEFSSQGSRRWHVLLSRMIRDLGFMCSNRALSTLWAANGLDSFLYTFSFDLGIAVDWERLGDYHGADIDFVFRNKLRYNPAITRLPHVVDRMADIMSCQWTSFAYSGSPNTGASPNCGSVHGSAASWPSFGLNRSYYSLQDTPKVVALRADNLYPDDEFPSDKRCDMWDAATFPWLMRGQFVELVMI